MSGKRKSFLLDMTMMFAIHDALRRELHQIARATARQTEDPRRVLGSVAGWQMFKSYLGVHHTCEDDTLWPMMELALTERPDGLALLSALEAEHATIEPLISAIDSALVDREPGPERFGDLTDGLATALVAHLSHEETEGLALIDATLTEQQWASFGQEHGKRLGPEAPRYLPWVLDGLDGARAQEVLELVPLPLRLAYRDEWQANYVKLNRWDLDPQPGAPVRAADG
jgi:hypothetical protein